MDLNLYWHILKTYVILENCLKRGSFLAIVTE